jgi:hypothetical protein
MDMGTRIENQKPPKQLTYHLRKHRRDQPSYLPASEVALILDIVTTVVFHR